MVILKLSTSGSPVRRSRYLCRWSRVVLLAVRGRAVHGLHIKGNTRCVILMHYVYVKHKPIIATKFFKHEMLHLEIQTETGFRLLATLELFRCHHITITNNGTGNKRFHYYCVC